MRKKITGLNNHPDQEKLIEYAFDAPEGEWTARLDDVAWGNSRNLLCYFSELPSGRKYRLSVFSNNSYRPFQGTVAFDEEPLGGTYTVRTASSKAGLPKFLSALRLD